MRFTGMDVLLTPKGSDSIARGNAPGTRLNWPSRLKAWDRFARRVAALQAANPNRTVTRGVAPGYAVPALRAENRDQSRTVAGYAPSLPALLLLVAAGLVLILIRVRTRRSVPASGAARVVADLALRHLVGPLLHLLHLLVKRRAEPA